MGKENINFEKKETPDFELTIVVNRHGPRQKEDHLGLTPGQKEEVLYRSLDDYKEFDLSPDDDIERKVVASPKIRVQETAKERQKALYQYGLSSLPVETDERLSEGGMGYYNDLLKRDPKAQWFQQWYLSEKRPDAETSTGRETAVAFSDWVLDTINKVKMSGGKHEVDAYSHAPAMAAFILMLEDRTGLDIIPKGKEDESRLEDKRISRNFPLMSSFSISISSKTPDNTRLNIYGKSFNIPMSIIENSIGK